MAIAIDNPDEDDSNDDADAVQGLLMAILAASSWPSTTGDDQNDNSVGWENVPGGSHVRTLDETNFQETIGANCCVLVFFHAKWCGFCGPIKPVFADVAAALQGGHCIVAGAVDCTNENELAMECNVHELPTMLFFWHGDQTEVMHYRGNWSVADMRKFAVDASAAAHKPRKCSCCVIF